MKLHQLRALRTIAESGSLQEASRLLEVTQPSLSKAVKELEGELGVPLLVRSNRGVTVTAYGERLVSMARLVTEEVRRARDEIDTLKGEAAGRVAIGVSPVTPSRAFANCFKRYRELYPSVQLQIFELRSVQLFEGLKEGRLDLVLTTQPAQEVAAGQVWHELAPQPSALAVRKGHPLAGARSLHELLDQEWLLSDPLEVALAGQFFRERQVAPPERITECSSSLLYLELAASTDAVSFWSQRMLQLPMVAQALVPLQIAETPPVASISMVTRPQELMTREARLLTEEVLAAFNTAEA
ncbi:MULTISPECIES: LysR family transcriptional regulator [Pseudomonas]|uniref:LysR family transcriptional regulator n=1 Tax=Pseudomonas nitroreducens TaxID=46680 RepID=UPI001E351AF9|nr:MULTISPECIES: LysR substrate-binding domain-containing protein [Pseudomonas]MCE4069515.1 LysR substrate-binding domain-containing protein [Pseudomonas nitritireducens]MCE4079322.1 LysR substrate-binding domain-containing protein [Pseudomonas nitroreducens]